MTATMKEVAALCDVSVKTVSNVVNGRLDRVSPETARRIQDALRALNYRPHLGARHLRQGRSGALALAVPSLTNPYFSSLCAATIRAAHMHGYTLLIEPTGGELEQERMALNGLSRHAIDGMILSPLALGSADLMARKAAVPVVLIGERRYETGHDHVAIDNVAAARDATGHLLQLGRRRVAAIGAPGVQYTATAGLRLRGYCLALEEAGIAFNPELVAPTAPLPDSFTLLDGAHAMRRLLGLDEPPDAVFCFNDLMALGALKVLHMCGYRIPDDVAVAGFDDIEEARFSTPSLTTISPDREAIARTAVAMLIERIAGVQDAAPRLVQPPYHLEVRGSTTGREPPLGDPDRP